MLHQPSKNYTKSFSIIRFYVHSDHIEITDKSRKMGQIADKVKFHEIITWLDVLDQVKRKWLLKC